MAPKRLRTGKRPEVALYWKVEDMVADGDTVAVRYAMTGTHRGETSALPHRPTKAVVPQSMASSENCSESYR